MHAYFVYMLRCRDGSFYIGITNDVERRVAEHQSGMIPKCYTHGKRPVKLVYRAEFREVTDAIAWEKHIKRWSRRKKEALVRGEYEKLPVLAQSGYAKRIARTSVMVRRAHHDTLRAK